LRNDRFSSRIVACSTRKSGEDIVKHSDLVTDPHDQNERSRRRFARSSHMPIDRDRSSKPAGDLGD
jgi:hypothetical protein